jgi:hypothetical protein
LNDELPPDLRPVADFFGLPNTVIVEKDWYVIQALAAIRALDTAPFRLIFGGGTALSRAHRLTRRMSEDIDLRITATEAPSRSALRRLRDVITDGLLAAGFSFDPTNKAQRDSGNGSKYTIYRLPYPSRAPGYGVLRPEIMVETAVWPLRRPPVERSVISFVAEALGRPPELATITCASIVETAAEKFVALTRRAGAELAGAGGPRDETLVRHVYDLHEIREHYNAAEVIGLAREIMVADVAAYGHQFPAYRDDPVGETRRAVEGLMTGPVYATQYRAFRKELVYGEAVEFETAIGSVQALASLLET